MNILNIIIFRGELNLKASIITVLYLGVKIGPIIRELKIGREIDIVYLEGKKIAIDALPTIYEMLATIRDQKGGYLHDSKGRITSHLVGLFNRTARMLASGIKPIFVFDGPPHPLKMKELEIRRERKEEAFQKYLEAVNKGDFSLAKKYAKQAMSVTDELVETAKQLLRLFGVPIIEAPHDGEAQAAFIVNNGEAFAVSSPDYDSFLFGAKKVIRNLKMTAQKKEVPTIYELDELLSRLNITREQLIDIALLLGTDYNPGGVPGIGQKKALEIIRKYGSIEKAIDRGIINWKFDVDVHKLKEIFLDPPINRNYEISFSEPKYDEIITLLTEEFDFSRDRVEKELEDVKKRLEREKRSGVQASLDTFFG